MPILPWDDERCIVCAKRDELTLEHVIPASLGGKLQCRFLCRQCNSQFGSKLDVQVKSDPLIGMAVHNLSSVIPRVSKPYFEGKQFHVNGEGPQAKAVYKGGTLKTKAAKLDDGSLIKHTSEARTDLQKALKKAGCSNTQIEEQLNKFDSAPENEVIDFLPGIPPMAKWTVHGFEPDWSGDFVCPEFLLKIAYEYTALSVGSAIFGDHFDSLRRALETCSPYGGVNFEQDFTAPSKACHGIAVTCRFPYTVQIMLLGKCRYKLTFPRVHFEGECISYYHDIASGVEDCLRLNFPIEDVSD